MKLRTVLRKVDRCCVNRSRLVRSSVVFTSFINASNASSSRGLNSAGCDEMKLSLK